MAAPAKRFLRWRPRFSLRSLIVLVLLLGSVGMFWSDWPAWEEVAYSRAIEFKHWDIQWGEPLWHEEKPNLFFDKRSGEFISLPLTNGVYSPDGKRVYAPDSKRLVSIKEGVAQIWDAENGQRIAEIRGYPPEYRRIQFASDRQMFAGLGDNNTVRVWDLRTGANVATMRGHTDTVTDVQFSPNCRLLATVSKDKTTRIWGTTTGELLMNVPYDSSSYRSLDLVEFSQDGQYLHSHDDDGGGSIVKLRGRWGFGLIMMPGFWLAIVFGCALLWSLYCDVRRLRGVQNAAS